MIAASAERDFYDGHYAQFLKLPDHALRVDRKTLEAGFENPAQPFYERRLLYRAAMRALEAEPLRGRRILDYGCGPADFGLWLAAELPLRDFDRRGDYSYGIYLYGFPVQQLLVSAGLNQLGFGLYCLGSLLVTLPLAVTSYWLVERPCLRLKNLTLRRASA